MVAGVVVWRSQVGVTCHPAEPISCRVCTLALTLSALPSLCSLCTGVDAARPSCSCVLLLMKDVVLHIKAVAMLLGVMEGDARLFMATATVPPTVPACCAGLLHQPAVWLHVLHMR
jgi:hypothetical protein